MVLELAEVPEVASSGDLDKDARTAMTVATNLEPLAVNEVNAITISGLEGIEVVGTARIEEVETEVFVYQVYLRGKQRQLPAAVAGARRRRYGAAAGGAESGGRMVGPRMTRRLLREADSQ